MIFLAVSQDGVAQDIARIGRFRSLRLVPHLAQLFRIEGQPLFKANLVDHLDSEIGVKHFVTHDVLQLLGGALHQAPALQGKDGAETVVEPAAFENASEKRVRHDEGFQLVPVGQINVRPQHRLEPLVGNPDLLVNLRHHAVAVVNLELVQAQGFDAVLISPGMHRFFIDLARLVDLQLGGGHLFHHRQADVAHGQDIARSEVGEHALIDVALLQGELVLVILHILGHVDVQRRPVVLVGVEKEFPGPRVLERRQLVDIGLAIDDPLILSAYRFCGRRRDGGRFLRLQGRGRFWGG